jgi:hypothetical protein
MSANGSSTFGAGLAFGSPFPLSEGGRAGAEYFGAPSDPGADGETFGAGRAGPQAAPGAGAFVTVGAAGGAVFAAGTACSGFAAPAAPCSAFVDMMGCSAFATTTAESCFSGRDIVAGAAGAGPGGLTGAFATALSLRGTALPLLAGALAGMIGGGIPGRG